jgi:hypothetical protein
MSNESGASVVFYRPARWRDLVRTYRLLLDGQLCAELKRGQEATVRVAPGRHVAQARIDRTGSPELGFEVRPGQVVRLIVEPGREGSVLAQAMSDDRYLSLSVEGSPIMQQDPTPREPRSVWAGLLAAGAAVVLVAQIALATASIRVVDGLLQGTPTAAFDRGLRLLPWLSVIELAAGVAGIVVVAATRASGRRWQLVGGFVLLIALAVSALAVRPAPDLLLRTRDYHQLRDLYATGLPIAVATGVLAWWTRTVRHGRSSDD